MFNFHGGERRHGRSFITGYFLSNDREDMEPLLQESESDTDLSNEALLARLMTIHTESNARNDARHADGNARNGARHAESDARNDARHAEVVTILSEILEAIRQGNNPSNIPVLAASTTSAEPQSTTTNAAQMMGTIGGANPSTGLAQLPTTQNIIQVDTAVPFTETQETPVAARRRSRGRLSASASKLFGFCFSCA